MKQLQVLLLAVFAFAFAAACAGSDDNNNNNNAGTKALYETGCSATVPCEQNSVCRDAEGNTACHLPCDTSCFEGMCVDGFCLPNCRNGTCQGQLVCDDMDRCVAFIDEDS